MKIPIYQVDAFTSEIFKGNPAAICPLSKWLPDEIMQKIAMENNLSNMEAKLNGADKLKHKDDIKSNRDHLDSLKNKNSTEWREYATQCMIEILNQKGQ